VLRPGVNIYGYVYAESGVGEHTRLLVESVKEAGLDYAVIPFTDTTSRQQARFNDLGQQGAEFMVNIIGVNADVFPEFAHRIGPSAFCGRYTIGLWAWEIEDFPVWMAKSSGLVDEVWANSSFSAEAIQRVICRPVLPFPLPIATPSPPPRSRSELGLPEGYLYFFCFDFDSVFARKNPLGLVEAYRKAFPDPQGPSLVIKSVNGDRHREQLEQLLAAAGERPDINVVDGYWEDAEQKALMGACDAYVSLHRSEGFGLTIAEAMALGKPVIATSYSGNLDFMTEANSYLVPYELAAVGRDCGPYPESSVWAQPDIDAAAGMMRRVWEKPHEALAKTEQAKLDIELFHSPRARAQFVSQRLAIILDEISDSKTRPFSSVALLSELAQGDLATEQAETSSEITDPVMRKIIQGPDIGMPTRFGWPVKLFRWFMIRLLQNYAVYQRGVDEELIEAITRLDRQVQELRNRCSANPRL
jgi:glycosyltransferase involved in cell wall biosynthesis